MEKLFDISLPVYSYLSPSGLYDKILRLTRIEEVNGDMPWKGSLTVSVPRIEIDRTAFHLISFR